MRKEIQTFLASRPDLKQFVREQPLWYRLLSRSPERIFEIEQEARLFYGKTMPQRIERIQQQIQLATMLLSLMNVPGNIHEN